MNTDNWFILGSGKLHKSYSPDSRLFLVGAKRFKTSTARRFKTRVPRTYRSRKGPELTIDYDGDTYLWSRINRKQRQANAIKNVNKYYTSTLPKIYRNIFEMKLKVEEFRRELIKRNTGSVVCERVDVEKAVQWFTEKIEKYIYAGTGEGEPCVCQKPFTISDINVEGYTRYSPWEKSAVATTPNWFAETDVTVERTVSFMEYMSALVTPGGLDRLHVSESTYMWSKYETEKKTVLSARGASKIRYEFQKYLKGERTVPVLSTYGFSSR